MSEVKFAYDVSTAVDQNDKVALKETLERSSFGLTYLIDDTTAGLYLATLREWKDTNPGTDLTFDLIMTEVRGRHYLGRKFCVPICCLCFHHYDIE